MKLLSFLGALAAMLAATNSAHAQKAAVLPDKEAQVVLSGLDNPCGVAVQPGTGHVFVSDSAAGKILRVIDGKSEVVISDFPQDIYGKGPMYNIGPLGLAFLDKDTLVVGGGGLVDGKELLRVYTVPAPGKSITVDDMKHKLGPIEPGEASLKGEGNFYGLAITKKGIYVTSNGDDNNGWILRAGLSGGEPDTLTPYIKTKVATNVDAPVGIAVLNSPDGVTELVVGQMGEINKPHDSLLTFYSEDGKMVHNAETGLHDIASLAVSPRTKGIYAVDFAWMDTKEGGLFRLEYGYPDNKLVVDSVKLLSLDKPSALAFGEDGTLYITVFGTAKEGSDKKPGQLLKITPGL